MWLKVLKCEDKAETNWIVCLQIVLWQVSSKLLYFQMLKVYIIKGTICEN